MSVIGARLPRKEDPRMLRGNGRFGDDFSARGQVWARIVRSPVAHGRVRRVDAGPARGQPGVVCAVTAADLPPGLVIPVRLAVQDIDLSRFLQPVLAAGVVRYVGEPLAVVLADDPYAAEDAAELVDIDIEEAPAVLDARAAALPGATALFRAGNVAADFTLGYGDTDAAFAAAATVVEIDVEIGRHTGVPLEPRALLADVGPDGALSVYGMTKVPVFNRDVLAGLLGIGEDMIHVHAVDAGGGFGVRGEFYPEDFLVPWLAVRLGRPVKWTEDRAEHLVAVNHSRQQAHRIAAAFDQAGRITALRDDIVHDNGAYCRTHGIAVPELTVTMLPGPYRVPAYRGRVQVVLTSKTPCGTYRAPGRFEGTMAREQLLDVAAQRLGLDRAELRRRNLLEPGELPHTRAMTALGTEVVLDAADYPALLTAAVAQAGRLGYPAEVARGRDAGRLRGLGLAVFLEKSGLGPRETADVSVGAAGTVSVFSGGTSFGQGIETALAQITADALGVSPESVRVVNGDTARQPFGMGSWASRSTVVAGNAVHAAALAVRDRARQLAARILEVAEDDLEVAGGGVRVRGDPDARVTLAEVARAAGAASTYLRPGEPPGLAARRQFDVAHMTYPYGVHIAVVEVDPGTGRVVVLRYLVAYEVGRAVNPAMVEGQLRGGAAQGIGGALMEELAYDETGQPVAITFMDYRMPTAAEIPPIDVLVTQQAPAPGNPLGVRGAGEGGITAAGAVLASAVRDALGRAENISALPMTPARVQNMAESVPPAGKIAEHELPADNGTKDERGRPDMRPASMIPPATPGAGSSYVSKTDMVAALIRELIFTGELAAGEQLRQRDLAQRFQVSQTPVREALRRLESEGLVIGDTHRGFTVVEADEGRSEENFQIRAALESLGASLAAAKIDAAGVQRLEDLNAQMQAVGDDDARYAELNREFHFSLYEYARSPLLISLMRLLWASLHGGPRVLRTHAESVRQHQEILDALRAGDGAAAAALTHRHIMGAEHLPGN
ncbi:MAG TPA: molybdopterin cofactor-binding domain-containing protein [Streptosporangiaceae bacterium]